jgi:NADPH-dependent ferric siderophore reductase
MDTIDTPKHGITRIRREPRRRQVTVSHVTELTPTMRRIEFTSPELHDFESASPDDHVKLFVPDARVPQGTSSRDYTPRAFDTARGTLTIDFALHDAGPATAWALSAKVDDRLLIGGPRGSAVVADDFDFYVLIGDETALPAIGRRVETLRAGVPVTTLAIVDGPEDVQHFATAADWRPHWVYRSGVNKDDAALLREAASALVLPDGEGYVWIAAEARTARQLRDYWLAERGHPKAWLKAAGYWVAGKPGESEKY